MTTNDAAPTPMLAWAYLLLAHARATEEVNRRGAEVGMPPIEWYDVLWALERAGNQRMCMSDVADLLTLSRANFTRLLDRMEAKGLVRRERSQKDRRTVFAVITPEGKRLRKKMWPIYEEAIHDVFISRMTPAELVAIANGLKQVALGLAPVKKVCPTTEG